MKVKAGIIIFCLNVFVFMICAGSALHAQTSTALPQSSGITSQDSTNDLSVAVGKSVLLDFEKPVARVAIGQSEVAETAATSPSEIMVDGKAPGETSLIVWLRGGGRQFFNVTVRPSTHGTSDQLDAVRRQLSIEFPGQPIKVSSENGFIFLRGTVKDLNSADRAVQIATTSGKVINLLYVNVPPAEKQVLLKVRFASFDRNVARSLGINFYSTGLGNTLGTVSTGQFSPPTVAGSTSGATATITDPLNISAFFPGLNAGATIKALEAKGVVQVLAEPNLLASNGKQASFLAGGEYPYPVAQGSTSGITITIMFKEYGVRLAFLPTITPRGTIRLQVAPEVSALDFTNAVTVSGFTVPAITSRKVKTEVELNENQSFIIGGLLDNRETETFQKLPFLGDVPILGKFFQSKTKNRTNTELIVIVTPELVDPIPAGAPLPELKYPNKFLPANSDIPMHTPDTKPAGTSPDLSPESMPVEALVQSMKQEKSLNDSNTITGAAGAATDSGLGSPK